MVRTAATRLYAEAPADFVATRTALVTSAKADGDKEAATAIAALRKPSVAAWLLNQLVHRAAPVIESLTELGAQLRQATARLDAAAIAELRPRRDSALADLVTAAVGVAGESGQKVSAAVESEIRNTGIAALADEAAEEVLTSGTLTRALSYSGFGEVDLSEAAAMTSTGVVLTSIRGGRTADRDTAADDTGAEPAAEVDNDTRNETGDETDDAVYVTDDHDADEKDEAEDAAEDDGAAALAEAAAAAERERRLAQAEEAVGVAEKEIGRRRSAVESARNRTEATRQRIQKLQDQLERARAEDEDALEKLTEALGAAKQAGADLEAAREHLATLREEDDQE